MLGNSSQQATLSQQFGGGVMDIWTSGSGFLGFEVLTLAGGVSTQRRSAGCLAEGAACVEDLPGTKLMTVAVLSIATRTDFMA